MTLTSLPFLLAFLPAFFLVFQLTPHRLRAAAVLLGSAAFCTAASWQSALVLAALTWVNWTLLRAMARAGKAKRRRLLAAGAAGNAALLLGCKVSGWMPAGISFTVFSLLSSLSGGAAGQPAPGFLEFGAYSFFFPKLQEGPIQSSQAFCPQLPFCGITAAGLESGLRKLFLGLGYKVLLADKLAILWGSLRTIGLESVSTPLAWLGMYGYSLQLYFDFHGYTMMAVGIAQILGLALPENFSAPYCAKSVGEFYRRWHKSLGLWFRDMIYIPLGGSRCDGWKTVRNLALVWLLTGLWHGLAGKFLLWAGALWLLIVLEKTVYGGLLQKHSLLGHGYVLVVIPLTWMLFANGSVREAGLYFARLFPTISGHTGVAVYPGDFGKQLALFWPYLTAGALFCLPQPERLLLTAGSGWKKWAAAFFLAAVFYASLYAVHRGGSNPFLYLQF